MAKSEDKKRLGRPNKSNKDHLTASSAEKGTAAGYMRKTFLVKIELAQKFDAMAFWDRKTVKDVLQEAMSNYILTWEKKNGTVKQPEEK